MKVLINTPDTSFFGGVANHYKGLKPYWSHNVKYNFVGGRKRIPGPILLIYDYLKFFILCAFGNYDVILLNPSLGKTAIKRDALFLRIASVFKIKTVVFFHGWSPDMVNVLNISSKKFCNTFNKADKIIVLAKSFKTDLMKWGITRPIYLTTTKVNDEMLKDFDFNYKPWDSNILFLTRIEIYKGIFTTLEAYKILKPDFPNLSLTIAGDGSKLEDAKDFVKEYKLEDVTFLGSISGDELIKTFSKASIYILPSHGEGMPTSVLEAMAFGIPIISRPVGGLVDFFKESENGYLIESYQPEKYAGKITQLLKESDTCKRIGEYNHIYAKNNFMASKVALKLEEILNY
ncbi:glycosyltransferase involved in cell wall biosynthesis [Oceanihabitans sediminis]|uniref:Glycosyltransferase family 1 protein n=1 Tax=Oceanihabitans sediminis TaxID=1812012 RepID=A0A368P6W4_9FLAO|nr:glycosyltransferase family 4 protein [Oceanihabitans sediminis]RBP27056.1 glycosyltransferase involved in cell wall biosynthesis [Oceanihabitans sediminis]RCU58627.1 glycosyltransferase family 1 protein [Oceanihabitans sediminis]